MKYIIQKYDNCRMIQFHNCVFAEMPEEADVIGDMPDEMSEEIRGRIFNANTEVRDPLKIVLV